MCRNSNPDCRCIADILKVILILQRKVTHFEPISDPCDKKELCCGCKCKCKCNTRPVQLILVGGNGNDPLVMPTTRGPITEATCFSDVFRVEKVDDCCATFRVLVPEKRTFEKECDTFVATDSFFTLDLRCVCIIRCLEDTFVECL
jgi:hypothetical protein